MLCARARDCLSAAAAAEGERITALLEEQSTLEARRLELAAAAAPARAEREGLEHHTAALRSGADALDAWLAENEARIPAVICADEALQPADAWARQALEAAAEDAAAEDALYSLARALEVRACHVSSAFAHRHADASHAQGGQLGLEAYLRAVRQLCREQFFARATGLVVAGARARAHAARPL